MTDIATRNAGGRQIPPAGSWNIDTSHSNVGFVARHMMVAKVRGSFTRYEVDLVIGEDPSASTLSAKIDAASFSTGDEARDGHVIGADFLDAAAFPEISFVSTRVAPTGRDAHWDVTGDLTLHGVTRPVTLDVEFSGAVIDPWNNERAIFEATVEIDREDFGVTWNQPLAGGGVLIGKKVRIELTVEAVRQVADA